MIHVYLDESGDLGFGQGGTKYFTIAFVIMKNTVEFKRCVRKVKIKYHIPREVELKGNTTRTLINRDLLNRFSKLDIEVHAIAVKKVNVESKLQKDPNILYNYVVGLSLVERTISEPKFAKIYVNVDRREVSVSALPINDYLKYKIWYEGERREIDLHIQHLDSHESYAIQGIDVICNSIFKKYNSNNYNLFNVIQGKVQSDKRVFFGK